MLLYLFTYMHRLSLAAMSAYQEILLAREKEEDFTLIFFVL